MLQRAGRPRTIPRIERARNIRIEHYVMDAMARGRTFEQAAAALGVSAQTVRRHLRRRGYRIECETRCVAVGRPPRPGRSVAAR